MTYQHQQLASGRWAEMPFLEQMANIGSEVERAISWRKKGRVELSQGAFFRALELLDLTIEGVGRDEGKLGELCRCKELFADFFIGSNLYSQTNEMWQRYFYHFTYAARLPPRL